MIGDVPFLADVSEAKVVSPKMAECILVMLPGLLALTEAAGETRSYTCFMSTFKEGVVSLSYSNPKFFGLYLRTRERTCQRFQTDLIGEYLAQKCYNTFVCSLFPAPSL